MNRIYVKRDGKLFGPFTFEQLLNCINLDLFSGTDFVTEDQVKWVSLDEFKQRRGVSSGPAPKDSAPSPAPVPLKVVKPESLPSVMPPPLKISNPEPLPSTSPTPVLRIVSPSATPVITPPPRLVPGTPSGGASAPPRIVPGIPVKQSIQRKP